MQFKPQEFQKDGRSVNADKFLDSFDRVLETEVPVTPIPVIIDYENEAMYNLARRLSNASEIGCTSVNFGDYRPTRKMSNASSLRSSKDKDCKDQAVTGSNEIRTNIGDIKEGNLKIKIKGNRLDILGEQQTSEGYTRLQCSETLPDYLRNSSLQRDITSRIEKFDGDRILVISLPAEVTASDMTSSMHSISSQMSIQSR